MTNHTIGIDISKNNLDAFRMRDGESRTFSNDRTGHKALIAWIGRTDERIVYEPTGPYHRDLEARLAQAGFPLVKVNPRQARRFAEATGKFAKTDRLDAAMLARMASLLGIEARPVASPTLAGLKELQAARDALVRNRTRARNRAKTLSQTLLKRQNQAQLRQIQRQIAAIEKEILGRINANPDLERRFQILVSIPGVSTLTACAILIEMPEIGTLDQRQAASLAGLAPVTRQSGTWKGRAFIRGGRANLRQALYMPALVAMRFNKDLKAKYEHLIAAGKPAKVAITAIMRKLIILANALVRDDRVWLPSLP